MAFDYLIGLLLVPLPICIYGLIKLKVLRRLIIEVGITGCIIGGIWDNIAMNIQEIWFFNPDKILGIWIAGLPLEEWLFFFLVSMMVATIAFLLHYFNQKVFKCRARN